MKVINSEPYTYYKSTKKHIALVVSLIVAALILNLLLCIFRTERTHLAFLLINIICDIAVAWFATAWILIKIKPRKRLLNLYLRGSNSSQEYRGVVDRLSEDTICIQGFICNELSFKEKSGRKIFVVENGGIKLTEGKTYIIRSVDNIAVEAEEVL